MANCTREHCASFDLRDPVLHTGVVTFPRCSGIRERVLARRERHSDTFRSGDEKPSDVGRMRIGSESHRHAGAYQSSP